IGDESGGAVSYADYLYYREHNRSFAGLFAASDTEVSLSDLGGVGGGNAPSGGITALLGIRFFEQMAGTAEIGRAAMVSENYFSLLGIPPFMGRSFAAPDGRNAEHGEIILRDHRGAAFLPLWAELSPHRNLFPS